MAQCQDIAPHITPPNPPKPSGGGGVTIVNATYDEQAQATCLDKTYGEILEAFQNGPVLVANTVSEGFTLVLSCLKDIYSDGVSVTTSGDEYFAETENDYPCNGLS